ARSRAQQRGAPTRDGQHFDASRVTSGSTQIIRGVFGGRNREFKARGAVMTAIAAIIVFVIFFAALNVLEKGRID
ncbi:MAG: hypothetical protein AAGJ87_08195, partial [Pseudomonadota bacterium]